MHVLSYTHIHHIQQFYFQNLKIAIQSIHISVVNVHSIRGGSNFFRIVDSFVLSAVLVIKHPMLHWF